jgi:hypothetical protein
MGVLDFLTSTRRPAPGTPVKPTGEVIARLKSLNRPTAPFQVIDGRSEGVDLHRLTTKELKTPLPEAVTGAGWTYKGVAFGNL